MLTGSIPALVARSAVQPIQMHGNVAIVTPTRAQKRPHRAAGNTSRGLVDKTLGGSVIHVKVQF